MTILARISVLAWLSLCLALAACSPPKTGGVECYPTETRRWISTGAPAEAAPPAKPATTRVFVDGSGSMAGYLRGDARERLFQDLVASLPNAAGQDPDKVRYTLFAGTLHDIPAAQAHRLQRPETYACGVCDNQESHLDTVLTAIASAPKDGLSLIVTDLWQVNSEVMTTGAVAFTNSLTSILSDGRSVAVYGFDAPYEGLVADLPSGDRSVRAARRPLFLLAAGPAAQLHGLDRRMNRSPSALIAGSLASGRAKHSLFTLTPERPAAAEPRPFAAQAGAVLRPSIVLRTRQSAQLQQFSMSRGAALRAGGNDAGAPRWTGPKSEGMLDGAVWSGPLSPDTQVWTQRRDKASCNADQDWQPYGRLTAGWRAPDGEGRQVFELSGSELGANLRPGTYLIVGRVRRVSLTSPNPANVWMRDWSFSDKTEAEARGRPGPFPTLNLSETARLMESALAEAAERSPTTVAGFAVALRVEK